MLGADGLLFPFQRPPMHLYNFAAPEALQVVVVEVTQGMLVSAATVFVAVNPADDAGVFE